MDKFYFTHLFVKEWSTETNYLNCGGMWTKTLLHLLKQAKTQKQNKNILHLLK